MILAETRVKVIPQKSNLPMNFFEVVPESSLLSTFSETTMKMIGHHSRLRTFARTFSNIDFCRRLSPLKVDE